MGFLIGLFELICGLAIVGVIVAGIGLGAQLIGDGGALVGGAGHYWFVACFLAHCFC
jgi:hypothetical protein